MDSHNKIEKLEEKKKLKLQLLKINYELSTPEILVDKHIKEKGEEKWKEKGKKKEKKLPKTIKEKENELHKLLNKQYYFEERIKTNIKLMLKIN